MRAVVRASPIAGLLPAPIVGRSSTAHARSAAMQTICDARTPRRLSPGRSFQLMVRGLRPAPSAGYCLGMASLRARYGIPVTLRPAPDGRFGVRATIPSAVFPAEAPGPFLLFVGQCTDVAPEGLYASMRITILLMRR